MTFPIRRGALAALFVVALVPATFAAEQTSSSVTRTNSFHGSVSGLYVSPTGTGDIGSSNGFGVLAAVGYGPDVGLREELEFGYANTEFDVPRVGAANVDTISLMVNGVYHFDAGKIRPYVGAGIGAARHNASVSYRGFTISDSATEFAYQGILGVRFPLSDGTDARLGYKFFSDGDFDAHILEAGLMFRF